MRQLSHLLVIVFTWIGHALHPGDMPIVYDLWHHLLEHRNRHEIVHRRENDT